MVFQEISEADNTILLKKNPQKANKYNNTGRKYSLIIN